MKKIILSSLLGLALACVVTKGWGGHGADKTQESTVADWEPALHRAAKAGDIDTVKQLLSKGADPLLKNKAGKKASEVAQPKKLKELLRAAEITWLEKESATAANVEEDGKTSEDED